MRISDSTEARTQALLPKSTSIAIDDSVLYTNIHFFRYAEGSKHITGDCEFRFVGRPDPWYPFPWIVRELFAQKTLVLQFNSPVCWDNENEPIPPDEFQRILAQMEKALKKRFKRYKIEINNREFGFNAKDPSIQS